MANFNYYFENFKIELKRYFLYTQEYIMMLIMNVTMVFIQYALFSNLFYAKKQVINGFTKENLLQYFIINFLISQLTFTEVHASIKNDYYNGKMVLIHSKPMNYILHYFSRAFSNVIGNTILMGIPTILIMTFIFHFSLSIKLLLLLYIEIIIIYTMNFFIYYIIGIISFSNTYGLMVKHIYTMIYSIFSGFLIPLNFFPKWLQNTANILPFKYMAYEPIMLFISFNQKAFFKIIEIQIFWIVILYIIVKWIHNRIGERLYING
ncbi:MAG: hypothetical protein B6I29_04990 [Marinitoga sp. 4572_148]|nr:MAG: hypothetical protein B6I29_04990 [Marinitoga sp. 4572_148]